jgi:hypothetical protein
MGYVTRTCVRKVGDWDLSCAGLANSVLHGVGRVSEASQWYRIRKYKYIQIMKKIQCVQSSMQTAVNI